MIVLGRMVRRKKDATNAILVYKQSDYANREREREIPHQFEFHDPMFFFGNLCGSYIFA